LNGLLEIVEGRLVRNNERCRVCRVKKGLNAALAANPVAGTSIRPAGRGYCRIPKRKNPQQGIAGGFRRSS
jgi:hypothetical protein